MATVIRFVCPTCFRAVKAPATAAGRFADCPDCEQRTVVPASSINACSRLLVSVLQADEVSDTEEFQSDFPDIESDFAIIEAALTELEGPFVLTEPYTVKWLLGHLQKGQSTHAGLLRRLSLSAEILRKSGDSRAIAELVAHYLSALRADNWSDSKVAECLGALGWQPEARDRAKFAAALGNYDLAVEECASDPGLRAELISILTPLLRHDSHIDLRRGVAGALAKLRWQPANMDERVALALVGENIDAAATELLAAGVGADELIALIRRAPASALLKALGQCGSARPIPFLINFARQDHSGWGHYAVTALEALLETCASDVALEDLRAIGKLEVYTIHTYTTRFEDWHGDGGAADYSYEETQKRSDVDCKRLKDLARRELDRRP